MKKKIDKNRYTNQKIKTIINFKNLLNEKNNKIDNDNNIINSMSLNNNLDISTNKYMNFIEKYNIIKIDKIINTYNCYYYILSPTCMNINNIELHLNDDININNIIKNIFLMIGEKELYEIKFNNLNYDTNKYIIPFHISFFNNNIPINLLQYHRLIIKIIFNDDYYDLNNKISFFSNQTFSIEDCKDNNKNNFFIKTNLSNLKYQTGLKHKIKEEYIIIKEDNKITLDYIEPYYFTYIYFDNNVISLNKFKNILFIIDEKIICKYDTIDDINLLKKHKNLKYDNVIPFFYNISDFNEINIKNISIQFQYNHDIKKMEILDKINLEKKFSDSINTKIIISNFFYNNQII